MSKDMKPMDSGIYGVIGKPGSGKSYLCAKLILAHAVLDKRPVFTNIPIRLKRMRAYIMLRVDCDRNLRRSLSKLVRPTLTKQHFSRFCERLSWISDRIEELKDGWENYGGLGDAVEELDDAFWKQALIESEDEYGPLIYAGAKANWFPPGAVLFLDEVHKWFAAKNYRDEPKYVLDLTSMHRHLQLMVYVVTQRWMNASLSFRSMATELIRCMNYARVPLLGPLRLHTFGLNLFRVGRCLPEDFDERNDELKIGKKDISFDFEFPLFNGGIFFNLYRSHVHGGSLMDQAKELRDVRAQIVGDRLIDELENKKAVKSSTKKRFGMLKYAFFFACGFVLASLTMKPEKEIVNVPVQTQHRVTAVQARAPAQRTEKQVWEDKQITGVVSDGVYLGQTFVRLGSEFQGLRLANVDVDYATTKWTTKAGKRVDWTMGQSGHVVDDDDSTGM